jgi:hypothetical protein
MDRETIAKIEELALASAEFIDIDGTPMAAVSYHDITPKLHTPSTFALHTLDGLAAYVANGPDKLMFDIGADAEDVASGARQPVVHVISPTSVAILSGPMGPRNERCVHATATVYEARGELVFSAGHWYTSEQLIIILGSQFADVGHRADVLRIVGNVSAEESVKTTDDGIGQTVTAKAGVALVDRAELPNPVELAPFRTFRELPEQPSSAFLLRARGGKTAPVEWSLFEADGGAWRLDAVELIARYLEAADDLSGLTVIR